MTHATRIGARLLGVEHEYRVLAADGTQIDMRTVIDSFPVDGGVRCDPGDPHAIRCPHGGVLTADGREAEVATPPLPCGPGVLAALHAHLRAGEAGLLAALETLETLEAIEGTCVVEGYSTHLNVQSSSRRGLHIAQRLARQWSPALILLTHRRISPGLLIRPRWRRLEFGCEFLAPRHLGAAMAFATAAVASAERRRAGRPAALEVDLQPSRQRYGWYVDRLAFGDDLLLAGRSCRLRTASGTTILAQDHLESAWSAVRAALAATFDADTVATVDDMVGGRVPLPCEVDDDGPFVVAPIGEEPAGVPRLPLTYEVGGFTLRPATLTWRTAVFEVAGPGRPRWISIPGDRCLAFLEALHAGRFDDAIRSGHRRVRLDLGRPRDRRSSRI